MSEPTKSDSTTAAPATTATPSTTAAATTAAASTTTAASTTAATSTTAAATTTAASTTAVATIAQEARKAESASVPAAGVTNPPSLVASARKEASPLTAASTEIHRETQRETPRAQSFATSSSTSASTSNKVHVDEPSSTDWVRIGGVVTVLGILVAITSQLPWLGFMRAFQVHSVTLILGGLVVCGAGFARQTLLGLRRSLESVMKDTARIEQVSTDGQKLRGVLDQYGVDQQALKFEVVDLQAQLKRLMELAADPEQTVANFRLAASVDQLGARLDIFIKEQFRCTQQRLAEVIKHTDTASRSLTTRLDEVADLVAEQHQAQQLALREAIEPLLAVTSKTHAGVDQGLQATARVEARMQSQQSALANGFDSLDEGMRLTRTELSTGTNDLRASIEGTQQRVAEVLEHTDQASRSLGSRLDEAAQLAAQQHQAQQDSLREAVEPLHAAASKSNAGIEQGLEASARMEAKIQTYHGAVTKRFDSIAESLRLAAAELTAALKDLRQCVDREFQQHGALLDVRFGTIDSRFDRNDHDRAAAAKQLADDLEQQLGARAEELKKRLNAIAEDTQRGTQRVLGDLEQLGARLAEQSLSQRASLADALQPLSESASATKRELLQVVEQLGDRLTEQSLNQEASLAAALQPVCDSSSATKRELLQVVEQLGDRLTEQSLSQEASLAAALQPVCDSSNAAKHEILHVVEQLGEQLAQQSQAQEASLAAALQPVRDSSSATKRELLQVVEQLGVRLSEHSLSQEGSLATALQLVSDSFSAAKHEILNVIERLGGRLAEHSLGQNASLAAALQPVSDSFTTAKHEIMEVVERLGAHVDESAEIQHVMTEEDRATLHELGASIERLFGHMDQHLVEQLAMVQRTLQDSARVSGAHSRDLRADLEQIQGGIRHTLDDRLGMLERISTCVDELANAFDIPGHSKPAEQALTSQPVDEQSPGATESS